MRYGSAHENVKLFLCEPLGERAGQTHEKCNKEETYHFVDVETLMDDFQKDINWFRRQKNE